jgi:hypothetical protein
MEGVLASTGFPSHMEGTLASQYLAAGSGSGGKDRRGNITFQEDFITNQQGREFIKRMQLCYDKNSYSLGIKLF